jgi:superfamily II DNA or RNA helicase
VTEPPLMAFRWPWREYQARLLDALPSLMADQRLHVVAAPGSGKTVLGIEVFRRLGQPAVVLSPTRTIRDQWLARLDDFLPPGEPDAEAWSGRDLSDLRFFTSLTYQALHARSRAVRTEAVEDPTEADGVPDRSLSTAQVGDVANLMRAAGIKILILDEAHHLRADWWTSLQDLVSRLGDVTLVSLTGTPPYDGVRTEWTRYIDLCGPIDAEISVPELVKAGTLCPHEDYVWLSTCPDTERGLLSRHRRAVQNLTIDLLLDEAWVCEMAAHPWSRTPSDHASELSATPVTGSALLSLLRQTGRPCEALLEAMGLEIEDVPSLGPAQWELLLAEYLHASEWEGGPTRQRRASMATRLRTEGLLWRREISLTEAGRGWPDLGQSPAKVGSCVEIFRLERRERGGTLRMVVLTDYIEDDDERALGAWPIFLGLVREAGPADAARVVLHTGRLTLVHTTVLPHIEGDGDAVRLSSRPSDGLLGLDGFHVVSAAHSNRLTEALTHLLSSGIVHVVVGTRSLLGEGWDAPAVNSLVLASIVGSYVTTNQMRGRAIRRDPLTPDKVASIWHLGTVAELAPGDWDVRDLTDLSRRFDAFMGVAAQEPCITTGLGRLETLFEVAGEPTPPIDVAGNNDDMAARLTRRLAVQQRWEAALESGALQRTIPTVRLPVVPTLSAKVPGGDALSLGGRLLAPVVVGYAASVPAVGGSTGLRATLLAVGVAVSLRVVPGLYRDFTRWLTLLPSGGVLRAVGRAVRDALVETQQLPSSVGDAEVLVARDASGSFDVALGGGTFAQQSLFADCVSQVLGVIDDPRYLIRRRGRGRTEVHAIPTAFGSNAERAHAFLTAWERHVTPAELLYTRTPQGRAQLIRAQARGRGGASTRRASRGDRWF